MICPGCNRSNSEGLEYCDFCGTPLQSGSGGKRKTEMESGGGGGGYPPPPPAGGGGHGKRKTEMEGGAQSNLDQLLASDDPFAPDPFKQGGGAGAKPAAGGAPAPGPAPQNKKRATAFDPADPFKPGASRPSGASDEKYAGRRVVGWMISFDRNADGSVFTLREGRNVLGRDPAEADVAVGDDDMVSSRHSVIAIRQGKARLSDDRSQNGTFLNEEDVFEWTELKDGDVVRIGRTRLFVRLLDHDKLNAIWGQKGA